MRTMNVLLQSFALSMLLTLGACGGSDSTDAPLPAPTTPAPSQPPTGIGPAGGTVTGTGGAQVVVPPNALAQATNVAIAQSSSGAPALPVGMTAAGKIYALTPHGTTFASPVTLTVPFDPTLVPGGSQVVLLKTNSAQNGWDAVAGASVNGSLISAPVSSFSWVAAAFPAAPLNVRSRATRIATGSGFSVAADGGSIRFWGTLNAGIANATSNCPTLDRPCRINGPTGIKAVAAGGAFILGLRTDGQVIEFGYLPGTSTIVNAEDAQPIPNLTGVEQIAAGLQHALALLSDGSVVSWGASGMLGDGTGMGGGTPRPVLTAAAQPLTGVVSIAAAGNRSIALKSSGEVYTWGEDGPGLGLGSAADYTVLYATRLTALSGITGIAAGAYSSIFGNAAGKTWYAGNRLRVSDPVTITTPKEESALAGAATAAAGLSTLTASSASVWALIVDNLGTPHGIGTPSDVSNVNQIGRIVEVAAGNSSHVLFVDSAGAVYAWGQNSYGQIGDGTRVDSYAAPKKVDGITLN